MSALLAFLGALGGPAATIGPLFYVIWKTAR